MTLREAAELLGVTPDTLRQAMSDTRVCAINGCGTPAAGLMQWPDIHTFIELCQDHADKVHALEAALPGAPDPVVDAARKVVLDATRNEIRFP